MKKILLLLLPMFLSSCIWIDGTTIDGKYTTRGKEKASILKYIIEESSPKEKLESILDMDKNLTQEDKAVVALLKGDYNKSIESLLELIKNDPNKYSLASNLGTAYELQGNTKKALKWITEGIRRDGHAHDGSEWIHQYILELKIQLQNEPNLFETQRAIPLPKKFTDDDNITFNHYTNTILGLKWAIDYQLQERLIFVKPKDKIVAELLYTSALISAQTSSVEDAIGYLKLAKLYGFSNTKLLEEKKVFYQNIIDHPSLSYYFTLSQESILQIVTGVILVSLLLLIYLLFKKLFIFLYKKFFKQ